jgi:uncharacterized glyoxalase superfamily protein PhnB
MLDWLEEAFGFERTQDHRDEDGKVVHAEMALGDGPIMPGSGEPPEDTEFGTHRYRVLDPEGYKWSFRSYRPAAK